ncbi:MAG: hypothetical protein LBM60_06700, partial [Clostridium sp.]|nr:hypothetical protein [Clostridium sp.]
YSDALTNWAINKIKTQYPDDVALLIATPASDFHGDGHGVCFDYYIPATERGMELGRTFILDGVGHDLYPRTWERMERTADLVDWATHCLGNAEIKYSRSHEDTQRFEQLKQRLQDNLSNPEFVYRAALAKLDSAMEIYRTMVFESNNMLTQLRTAAGYIHHNLAMGVAFMNGTYLNSGTQWYNSDMAELKTLSALPDSFVEYYQAIIHVNEEFDTDVQNSAGEELKHLAYLSILTGRRFLAARKPTRLETHRRANYDALAEWYQEISLKWRRLYAYCDVNSKEGAFFEACNLQPELNDISEEYGIAPEKMSLLTAYSPNDLSRLCKYAHEIEDFIINEITSHGAKLHKYETLEDFLANE